MNARAFKLLIWNTVQKEIRSKTFFMAVFLTIAVLGLSYAIMHAFKDQIQVDSNVELFGAGQLLWIYYALVNALSVFLGLMFGLGSMRSDVSTQVIGQLLALPISRSSYLFARVLGSWILVIFYQLLSFALTAMLFGANLADVNTGALLLAPIVSFFPSLAAIILGLFVSLWLGKASGLIATGIASIGGSSARAYFSSTTDVWSNLSILKIVGIILWIIIPRFAAPHSFVHVLAEMPDAKIAWIDMAQFSISSAFLLLATTWVFGKRGF